MRADPRFNLDGSHFGIAILPVVVFVLGEWFLSQFGIYSVNVAFDPGKFSPEAEAGGRYVYYAMFLLFVVVSAGIVVLFVLDMREHFNRASQTRLLGLVAGLSALVVAVVVLGPTVSSSPKAYWFAGSNIFEDLFAQGKITSCEIEGSDLNATVTFKDCTTILSLKGVFIGTLKFANVVTALAAASAVAGAISCLGNAAKEDNPSAQRKELEEQVQRLNQYLYLGSVLMVSGMLLMLAWLHWPDFYFRGETGPPYNALVNGLSIYFGVNYSLVVFAYYAPVVLILSQRSAKVASNVRRESKPKREIETHSLGIPETFRVAFALMSPFLTGLLGTLVTMLTSGAG